MNIIFNILLLFYNCCIEASYDQYFNYCVPLFTFLYFVRPINDISTYIYCSLNTTIPYSYFIHSFKNIFARPKLKSCVRRIIPCSTVTFENRR